ncbi:MAG: DUF2849 domain-containing protein [Pseudomonadota bacterium]
MPKAFKPQILTANDLIDGDTVFWAQSGWTRSVSEARVAQSPEEATVLEAAGQLEEADNRVVGSYLVAVGLETGAPYPLLRREQIRAERAPTFAYMAPESAELTERPARAA